MRVSEDGEAFKFEHCESRRTGDLRALARATPIRGKVAPPAGCGTRAAPLALPGAALRTSDTGQRTVHRTGTQANLERRPAVSPPRRRPNRVEERPNRGKRRPKCWGSCLNEGE